MRQLGDDTLINQFFNEITEINKKIDEVNVKVSLSIDRIPVS